jgi:uncharacterized membrane protein AbrB (regulator of aidB expression)
MCAEPGAIFSLVSPSARIATALVGGLLLGFAASVATTQFDWGNTTVGLSVMAVGLAIGLLFASTVARRDDRR